MQAICGAALDNENEAPVGFSRCECDSWNEQRASGRSGKRKESAARDHRYLL
jgi:hypothetical protein